MKKKKLMAAIAGLYAMLEERDAQLKESFRLLDGYTSHAKTTDANIKALKAENRELEASVILREAEIRILAKEKKEVEEREKSLLKKIAEYEHRIPILRETIAVGNENYGNLKKELCDCKEHIHRQHRRIQDMKKDIEHYEKTNRYQEVRIHELVSENYELKKGKEK